MAMHPPVGRNRQLGIENHIQSIKDLDSIHSEELVGYRFGLSTGDTVFLSVVPLAAVFC